MAAAVVSLNGSSKRDSVWLVRAMELEHSYQLY
jgi:hypothetical protein